MKSINTKQNDMMRRINTRQSSAPVSSYQDIQTTAQVFVSKPIPKEMINNALQVFDSKPVPKKITNNPAQVFDSKPVPKKNINNPLTLKSIFLSSILRSAKHIINERKSQPHSLKELAYISMLNDNFE